MLCNNDIEMNPTTKKGRHWVPLLIMALLVLCCTVLFYAVPMEKAEPVVSREMPWFSLRDGVLYFDESKYTGGNELTVPNQINGIPVTAISDSCFLDCNMLTAIYLPETLNAIGENAFSGCTALRGIEIPEAVLFIGKNAFGHCTALEAVCISNKLQHIGSNAFDGCASLHYIYFLGIFQEWTGLYRDFNNQTVIISCEDGRFYQSGDPA